ncbi:MAG: NAD(P)-dependent oxidoreductase [Micrococcaceae bacterium]
MTAEQTQVAVLGDHEGNFTRELRALLPEHRFQIVPGNALDNEDLWAGRIPPVLQQVSAVVIIRERSRLTAEMMSSLPLLERVVVTGSNSRFVESHPTIPVHYTRSQISAVVEHTWALILSSARHVQQEAENLRHGAWQTLAGTGLRGKTLGVVGLGRAGRDVAQIGRAFGMRVLAWSPRLTPERARSGGAHLGTKEELFALSDIVTIHLRLSESTTGIIDAASLSRMKDGSLLVNTARAELIRENDLVASMASGRPQFLAMDVFQQEPLPMDSPLRTLERTLLTPHLGYATDDNFRSFAHESADILLSPKHL